MLKKLKSSKLKIFLFFIGYILMLSDLTLPIEISIILSSFSLLALVVFNLIFIYLSYKSIKILLYVYIDLTIHNLNTKLEKTLSALKAISIGAFLGFLSAIAQGFVIATFSLMGMN